MMLEIKKGNTRLVREGLIPLLFKDRKLLGNEMFDFNKTSLGKKMFSSDINQPLIKTIDEALNAEICIETEDNHEKYLLALSELLEMLRNYKNPQVWELANIYKKDAENLEFLAQSTIYFSDINHLITCIKLLSGKIQIRLLLELLVQKKKNELEQQETASDEVTV